MMRRSLLILCAIIWALAEESFALDPAKAPPAGNLVKLENCRLLPSISNDGDSFHVANNGREYIFRLYFLDCPEKDETLPQRNAEQAAYFAITPEQSMKVGKLARGFTRAALAKPFTVYTRWKDAGGRSRLPRYFAFVYTATNRDLAEMLAGKGLARIYGVREPLPDGTSARRYLDGLNRIEARAKRDKLGGWNRGNLAPR